MGEVGPKPSRRSSDAGPCLIGSKGLLDIVGWHWIAPLIVVVLILAGVVTEAATRVSAATDPTCGTSRPPDTAYTVSLCLVTPFDGDDVVGDQAVEAAVTIANGDVHVASVNFYLAGQRILSDVSAPYRFVLPTARWENGPQHLGVEARMDDDFTTDRVEISLQFTNSPAAAPTAPPPFRPTAGTPQESGEPFVLAAVGDGAGGKPEAVDVTNLIASWNPNLFLYLGDVYNAGTSTEYLNWYAPTDSYGRFREITDPTIGNHEYGGAPSPSGYLDYWGDPPHYYSVDTAGWHIISLDSTGQYGETGASSDQYRWLVNDLKTHPAVCTLVFFHHPVFSIGPHGSTSDLRDLWRLLVQNGVDIVLTGHDHNYQRWQPLNADGEPDPTGPTSFVVGTGGHSRYRFQTEDNRLAAGFDRLDGALRLELNPEGVAFRFVATDGGTRDSGSIECSGAPSDDSPPAIPSELAATASAGGTIVLTWQPAMDNVGTTAYDVYRNGEPIASVEYGTTFSDTDAKPDQLSRYQIRSRDAAGNVSDLSPPQEILAPLPSLFSDGFETGDLSAWSTVKGMTVGALDGATGTDAARATGEGAVAYARWTLDQPASALTYRLRFVLLAQGDNPVTLIRFRAGSGDSILGVYVSVDGKLGVFNDVTKRGSTSSANVDQQRWYDLDVRVAVDQTGAPGRIEVRLDGAELDDLSGSADLGSAAVSQIQLGDSAPSRSFDVAFDDVVVDAWSPPSAASDGTDVGATPETQQREDAIAAATPRDVGAAASAPNREGNLTRVNGPGAEVRTATPR